jgi:hydrogenase-4 component B
MTPAEILLVSVALTPLLFAVLSLFPAASKLTGRYAMLAALPALFVAISGMSLTWRTDALLLGLGLATGGEVRSIFLGFTAAVWACAAWYGRYYLAHDRHVGRYHFYFHGAMTGNFGLIIADDPVTFFTMFAIMSFLAYGLVIHDGQPASRRAGRVYLGMAVLGETIQFAALAMVIFPMIGTFAGPVFQSLELLPAADSLPTLLFALGFGIKAGLLGLHMWLPMAHPVAPTPASAVLSACMIKAGLIGWLFFLPLGEVAYPGIASWMIAGGLSGSLLAAVYGVVQSHPKAVLAYSSVSQMGLIITGVGVALAAPGARDLMVAALTLYAVHHAFAKSLLFLAVGMRSTRPLTGAEGAIFWSGVALAALALIGAPFTSGVLAKAALKDAIQQAGLEHGALVLTLLSVAAAGTTLLMVRFAVTLRRVKFDAHHRASAKIWMPWGLLLGLVILATFAVGRGMLLDQRIAPVSVSAAWKNLPALAGGLLLYVTVQGIWRRLKLKAPEWPPGDLFEVLAACACRLERILSKMKPVWRVPERLPDMLGRLRDQFNRGEDRLTVWRVGGVVLVVTAVLIFWLVPV